MMKYLTRSVHYKKHEPSKDAKKIYLICEGSVKETSYFSFFEKFSKNLEIIAIKSENGKTDPLKLMEQSKDLFFAKENSEPKYELNSEYGDCVWFVIDTDQWNVGNKIGRLKEYCQELNQESEMWHVAQSNPSFEQWLYFHFFSERPIDSDVRECITFKEFVTNKITGGFDNRKHPLLLEDAVRNSSNCYVEEDNQPDLYCTQMHFLGELILQLIRDDLAEAKRIASASQ